jgi:aspartyl-tRNA(Asn)/glutamyl-tRNA(Gln) amidotransferase subunit A
MDAATTEAFTAALARLRRAGAAIDEVKFACFADLAELTYKGGISAGEAYLWHQHLIEDAASRDKYDPRVLARILRGKELTFEDLQGLLELRRSFISRMETELEGYDAMVMPTTPRIAPPIRDLEESTELYNKTNLLTLRNTSIVNLFDGCSVSLPVHEPGSAPVGLMVAALGDRDEHLFEVASGIELLFPHMP